MTAGLEFVTVAAAAAAAARRIESRSIALSIVAGESFVGAAVGWRSSDWWPLLSRWTIFPAWRPVYHSSTTNTRPVGLVASPAR